MLDLEAADLLARAPTELPPSLSPADLLDRLGSSTLVVLVITADGEARLEGSLRRFLAERDEVDIAHMRASDLDPASLWFRLFAAPKLRRIGLAGDRVLPGYYLFRFDALLGWCPPDRPAGKLFAELVGLDG